MKKQLETLCPSCLKRHGIFVTSCLIASHLKLVIITDYAIVINFSSY